MKKKEAIAAIAFDGIAPDLQVHGELELVPGTVLIPFTPGNAALAQARLIKETLEEALSDTHDDDELQSQDFDLLEGALERFREMVLQMMLFPQARAVAETDFTKKLQKLASLR